MKHVILPFLPWNHFVLALESLAGLVACLEEGRKGPTVLLCFFTCKALDLKIDMLLHVGLTCTKLVISRPGRSQGLLYKHCCDLLGDFCYPW